MVVRVGSDRIEERRKYFQQYKTDVKKRGKPFYPFAMLHDTIMSLAVVVVIIALTVIWKFSIPGDHEGTESGWLGKLYDEPADPGTISFIPRPDWYFYFLFYLLRIFKWPESVVLGTVGIPTIALLLLIALPFIDLRAERRPLRRPVAMVAAVLAILSMGVLTYKGAAAHEALGSELVKLVPEWAEKQGFEDNQQAVEGATLFAVLGCANCHTYLSIGIPALGAPDLTEEGTKNKGIAWQVEHLQCPACVVPGSPMPSYASQGNEALEQLAAFLEASKGERK
jgi:menaquinol-cytochrome c reductase cytochrome b/c subunit